MRHALIVAALSFLALSGRAEAACTISTTAVNFGSYNVFNTSATPANGTITYRCGAGDHNIAVSISTGSSGSFANRTMKKSTENLTYNLYLDAAFATRHHDPVEWAQTATFIASMTAVMGVIVGLQTFWVARSVTDET